MQKTTTKKLPRKTKILAAGDIHGDTGLVKKLAERAKKENVDLIILTGDLTFFEQSTDNIIGPFEKLKKPILILHGNHESLATTDFLSEMYPSAKNLHGYTFKKENLGIFGAGGTTESESSEKKIFKILKKGAKYVNKSDKKIMITHMHAADTKSEFSGFSGSTGIKKAIEEFQPDIFIHSHIHEAEGMEEKIGKTKVINVSRKPKIFEI